MFYQFNDDLNKECPPAPKRPSTERQARILKQQPFGELAAKGSIKKKADEIRKIVTEYEEKVSLTRPT